MLTKEFLENVCNQIKYKPIREDISEELSLHIQEQKEEYIKEGLGEKIAEEKAVSNMGEADEIGKKLNKIHKPKFDWLLFLLVAVLIGFGFLVTIIKQQKTGNYCLDTHIIFFIASFIICIGIYFLDYRKVLNHPGIIYGITTIMIVSVILFGCDIHGRKYAILADRYFDLSNLSMFLYIISFVGFIKKLNNKNIDISIGSLAFKFRLDIAGLIGLSAFSIIMLFIYKTTSIALILFLSYVIIATIHIIKLPNGKSNLIKFYGILLTFTVILILFSILTQNGIYSRVQRILSATYNPDIRGNGWVNKLIGDVLENANMFSGIENEDIFLDFFDEGTDFPLISIISYCGTIYASIIICVIILFSFKLILDCKNIKDEGGRLLVVGFGSIILLQAICNILMSFNLIPIIGLNLPFISYGMNGLWVNMMMIAFILSIYRRKDILNKKGEDGKKININILLEYK